VLILDEPTGGLDPNQIAGIRDLIAQVGKEKTVMLSTHIMQEVEAICDRIIIINRGKVIADDTRENILRMGEKRRQSVTVGFDGEVSEQELLKIPGAGKVIRSGDNDWIIENHSGEDIRAGIFNFAVRKNLTVLSLRNEEKNLESVFRELTG